MAFAVPAGAFEFWSERLQAHQIKVQPREPRFGEQVLGFEDPDGIGLEIVAAKQGGGTIAAGGPISTAYAIRGFHGVTLTEERHKDTAKLLTDVMGFREVGH